MHLSVILRWTRDIQKQLMCAWFHTLPIAGEAHVDGKTKIPMFIRNKDEWETHFCFCQWHIEDWIGWWNGQTYWPQVWWPCDSMGLQGRRGSKRAQGTFSGPFTNELAVSLQLFKWSDGVFEMFWNLCKREVTAICLKDTVRTLSDQLRNWMDMFSPCFLPIFCWRNMTMRSLELRDFGKFPGKVQGWWDVRRDGHAPLLLAGLYDTWQVGDVQSSTLQGGNPGTSFSKVFLYIPIQHCHFNYLDPIRHDELQNNTQSLHNVTSGDRLTQKSS